MKKTSKEISIGNKKIIFEVGELAQQATSSVLARMGDTMVLATVVLGKEASLDYFPLSVEYVERLYAGGRIKGSRWVKREGRPTDDAILTARLIDRSIRPFFPKDFKREVQVIVTVLSVDGENDPDILSINAVSAALAISKIPWSGPIGASRIGIIEHEGEEDLAINPELSEKEFFKLDLVVSSTTDLIHMLEAGAQEVDDTTVIKAIKLAKEANRGIITAINELTKEVGEEKVAGAQDESYIQLIATVKTTYKTEIQGLIEAGVNKEVGGSLGELAKRIVETENASRSEDDKLDVKQVEKAVDYIFKKTIRELILERAQRPDKRKITEIRSLSSRIGLLPRTHGSGLFQRGETQVLSVATLATPSYNQLIEGPEGEETKRYMHHYSFPAYSVGETGRVGSPNRREIGHGALAERALEAVLPPISKFPYAIRVVSEVLSSNGSTSMASTCGSTLALMDAGVPISAPVAGIAMGLMTSEDYFQEGGEKKHVILTDIMGLEDFSGDMDFKVTGTTKGVTAIQLDVKVPGLTDEMVQDTMNQAKDARLFILEKMAEVIPQPRQNVSQFAPTIKTIKVDVGKIGDVIGSGGRVIKNIISTTGATVDVEDDGTVTISSADPKAVEKASEWVGLLARELQRGEVFEGPVKRLLPFGAFVEIVPGKEGLVHVSEMSTEYVKEVSDVVKEGQRVKVRVKEVDDQGRINLSMLFGPDGEEIQKETRRQEGRGDDRRDNRDRGDRGDRRGRIRDHFPGSPANRDRSGADRGDRGDRGGPRRRHH